MKKLTLALALLSAPAFADLTLLKIGHPPLGHCTGFFDHQTDSIFTAAHCIKNDDMPILTQNGEALDLILREDISFFVEALGVTDMAALKAPKAQDYHGVKIENMAELSALSEYIIVGYPEMNREGEDITILKCQRIYSNSAFDHKSIEAALGSLHLTCPTYIYQGEEQSTDGLLHRHIRGMSGGPVVSDGQVVGVAYHFNERDGSYKVQTLLPETRQMPYQQVWRPYQLDRRLFEEIKVPNNVNLQIDMWLFGLKKSPQFRNEVTTITLTEDRLNLDHPQENLSTELSKLPTSLRRLLETQRYPQ